MTRSVPTKGPSVAEGLDGTYYCDRKGCRQEAKYQSVDVLFGINLPLGKYLCGEHAMVESIENGMPWPPESDSGDGRTEVPPSDE